MKTFEKILVIIFIGGVLLQLFVMPGGALLLGFSLTFLSIIYFAFSFLLFRDLRLRDVFKKSTFDTFQMYDAIIAFTSGISLSITLTGAMFYLLILPGSGLLLVVGNLGLVLCLITSTVLFMKKEVASAKAALIRIVPVLIIGVWISLLNKYDWLEYRYSQYPDYLNAYKNAIEAESIGAEEADKMYEILERERIKMNEEMND